MKTFWNFDYFERIILPLLNLPQSGRVLDVGCGNGGISLLLADLRPDLSILGMDYESKPLEGASASSGRIPGSGLAIARMIGRSGATSARKRSNAARTYTVLEINEAGSLSRVLASMPGHRLVRYPDYDMMALPFESGSFDLVIHSDTLEHVPDPVRGLRECRRVLRRGGASIFTVPVVVGRLTRSRKGLPLSVHGSEGWQDSSLTVHTEFGADVWCQVLESGFDECRVVPYRYPAGIAVIAGLPESAATKGGQR